MMHGTMRLKNHLLSFVASCRIVKGLSKRQILKELKLAQQNEVYKWSTAMCYKGKLVSGFMATEKARYFYDGIK